MTCQCDMRTKLVGDGCETCNPTKALEYAKERIDELEAERDALAAQVVAMRAAFDDIEGANSTDRLIIREAISLDTSAAEAILREREAKTLEEACARVAQEAIDAQTACDCLHALAAELRACQECGMIGAHKLQCSTGGQTQLVLPAERREQK